MKSKKVIRPAFCAGEFACICRGLKEGNERNMLHLKDMVAACRRRRRIRCLLLRSSLAHLTDRLGYVAEAWRGSGKDGATLQARLQVFSGDLCPQGDDRATMCLCQQSELIGRPRMSVQIGLVREQSGRLRMALQQLAKKQGYRLMLLSTDLHTGGTNDGRVALDGFPPARVAGGS